MKYIIIFPLLCMLLQFIELQRFRITEYVSETGKIKTPLSICFLSDLHGKTYGKRLIRSVKKERPDIIIIGGDLVSKKKPKQLKTMLQFLSEIKEIAPVYYCFGNHETALDTIITIVHPERREDWEAYLQEIHKLGIPILRNQGIRLTDTIYFSALELPDMFYLKQEMVELTDEALKKIYQPSQEFCDNRDYHILTAHQPSYARIYEKNYHPDVILSGHTHGGLIRFPYVGSLISTELTLFPEFDGGKYVLTDKTQLIVSKGLGNHTYHIRILDRAEIVNLKIIPCKEG